MLRSLFGMGPKVDLKELRKNGATLLDVRTTGEFAGGHVKGAINIPLDKLQQQLKKLPKDKVVIACCLSGGRSGQAVSILKAEGYDAHNGGGWSSLDRVLNS
ncbi:MAG: rhodanese-like domain-containing protein [Flavobacteriales bacterium]|jgi:phage shock protein E|nr:rhodanese-like domain-containing protein [Flavobacteriales bacterium]MBP9160977.1 rhodanese-like domain-containing protein [Flavobacteriales bacterium]MCI1752418.1 rhodanese-like domain-containing protein [Flavobacteriales bacterium]